jgi:hypothetical protein
MTEPDGGEAGPVERLTALARLLTSLDRRVVETFDVISRVGEATQSVEKLTTDGSDLTAELRGRVDTIEARLYADLDEIKKVALEKLDDLDTTDLSRRIKATESAVLNIERGIVHLESLFEGIVEAAPGFMTRRVRERAGRGERPSAEEAGA